jgi:alpha-glucosidase/alpha-D-xyloside xylohydrolase
MSKHYDRRQVLKGVAAAGASLVLPNSVRAGLGAGQAAENPELEIQVVSVSTHTLRFTILPIKNGQATAVPFNGSLVRTSWGEPIIRIRGTEPARTLRSGAFHLNVSTEPLSFAIEKQGGELVQNLRVDRATGIVSFITGNSPLLGLGEGGPQFDRRGSIDTMRNGQGGYQLQTHGGRVPIPWLIGTAGWAMYIHQPFGTFDFTSAQSKFIPANADAAFPLDVFVVISGDPAIIMSEYAQLTGYAEMPPRWSLGYQQSHRTLASRAEILAEAKTFRDKKLPCDALIYLGTGFCPSGWNTQNGSFAWNSRVFPDPPAIIDQLHKDNFHVVLHAVILSNQLRGTVHDQCEAAQFDEQEASCYWDAHRKDFSMGVDGWWPDEGDPLDIGSRLTRHRMYWEGPQIDRPNERPYALHRNGCAGMQRYAAFLWSGDVYSRWETLKVHVPIAINTALTGIPYWGTDIGGFVPTEEFTAELYLRWFQFGAFCTLFRCHGRTWKLRLPWYDFWTGERIEGGREIIRKVDIETMPLYARAGSLLPLGPVKQYTEESVDRALSISIYPGNNASFLLYEDDGVSFNHRKGEWMGTRLDWNDAHRSLTMNLATASKMLPPLERNIELKFNQNTRAVVFDGRPLTVSF